MKLPVQSYSRISTHFGESPDPGVFGKHAGTDYVCPVGTPVVAVISGTVTKSYFGTTGGGQIEITNNQYAVRTLHMSRLDVKVGQAVTEGQQVGLSGNTGTKTTGPHCHIDIRKAGTAYDHSLNDYFDFEKLIGGNMSEENQSIIHNRGEAASFLLTVFKREFTDNATLDRWVGQDWAASMQAVRNAEWQDQKEILMNRYPALVKDQKVPDVTVNGQPFVPKG